MRKIITIGTIFGRIRKAGNLAGNTNHFQAASMPDEDDERTILGDQIYSNHEVLPDEADENTFIQKPVDDPSAISGHLYCAWCHQSAVYRQGQTIVFKASKTRNQRTS